MDEMDARNVCEITVKLSLADQDLRFWKGRIIMIYGTLIVMPFVILIVTMLVGYDFD